MDLNELLNLIDKENVKDIQVIKYSHRHGNQGQSGDYSLMIMRVGKVNFAFSNKSGAWESDDS